MVYAVYKDDGACGVCSQAMSITSPKTLLYIFDDNANGFWAAMKAVSRSRGRKNPRFTEIFSDNELDCWHGVVDNRKKK